MSSVVVDDLTYADLRRIAIEDLPGASSGAWTLHGAVDPGVTILELIAAYQLEQRLFMGEQLTEPIVRAVLRLLDVAEPTPALGATTVVSFRPGHAPTQLAAGTVLSLAAGPRFALADDVWVLPVSGVRAEGKLAARSDVLELVLEQDAGSAAGAGELSLLVEVAAAPGVAPSWQRGAVDVDPPATVAWSAVGPAGAEEPVDVVDSTGAFRRSGLLRVAWPSVWNEQGGEPRRLRATAEDASWTEQVRILGVHANADVAVHRVEETLDVSAMLQTFAALPDQRLPVPDAAGSLCDDEAVLSVTEATGEREDWTAVGSWAGVGPGDRVFVVDRVRGELRFGDGRAGRILRPGPAPAATLRFARGCGRQGNVGAWGEWAVEGGAEVATNPVPADGGAEPEPLETARQRAGDALARRDRTVTEIDACILAETTPGLGLARAHVSLGFHPDFPCASVPGALAVTIVPHADRSGPSASWTDAPMPDAGALSTTLDRLQQARLIGQEVFVLEPVYRRVTVEVTASATSRADTTRDRMLDALRRHLDPLVGSASGDGWQFGGAVRPSALVEVLQEAAGPEVTVTRLTVAIDDDAPTDCADLSIGPRELVYLDSATITWVTSLPTGRGLR